MKNYFLIALSLAVGFGISQLFFALSNEKSGQTIEQTSVQTSEPEQRFTGYDSQSKPEDEFEAQSLLLENGDLKAQLKLEREATAQLLADNEELARQLEDALAENTERPQNTRFGGLSSLDADTLIAAGLTQIDAERALELENEARGEIQDLFTNPNRRSRQAVREILSDYSGQIREELGDFSYETYLQVSGRPTAVNVAEVAENSRGATAGIQPGDEIISYAGERVFNIFELQSAVRDGTEGETVLVELIRDDIPQVVVLTRGQIGITSGSR